MINGWKKTRVPYSEEAYEAVDGHSRKVWKTENGWVAQFGGFLVQRRYSSAKSAMRDMDKVSDFLKGQTAWRAA